jgi:glycosyltransferase involved in cell wall biosynthesis
MPDVINTNKVVKKLHFLWRSVSSPLRFWRGVRHYEDALIIWNDFDQSSVLLWVPMVKLQRKASQATAVLLHDPDRDAYPPNLAVAQDTMLFMMQTMDLGFYHEVLADRVYYQRSHTQYQSIPHGSYPLPKPDAALSAELNAYRQQGFKLASITGNIRHEKNYHLAIAALADEPTLMLVVAGRPANSGVNTAVFKQQARELGVLDRIIWLERYLSPAELAAVLACSDVVLLAYSSTFKSQSGIFANLVQFQSNLVASAGDNALAILVRRFGLGELVEPDNLDSLKAGIHRALDQKDKREGWFTLAQAYTWQGNIVSIVNAANDVLEQRLGAPKGHAKEEHEHTEVVA